MSKRKNMLLGLASVLLITALFCVKLTGGLLHMLLGIVLVILMLVHTFKKRERKKYVRGSFNMVDNVLLAAMAVMVISGILMHPLSGLLLVKILHKLSSLVFSMGCIVHVMQHKGMRKR